MASVKVIKPRVDEARAKEIMWEMVKPYKGSVSDFFVSRGPNEFKWPEISEDLSWYPILKDYARYPASTTFQKIIDIFEESLKAKETIERDAKNRVKGKKIKIIGTATRPCVLRNLDFEIFQPVLDYRPMDVRVEGSQILVQDLYSGEAFFTTTPDYPELDGFQSLQSHYLDQERKGPEKIAQAVSISLQHELFVDRIEQREREYVRNPRYKGRGEMVYFPLWEVPLIVEKVVEKEFLVKIEYSRFVPWRELVLHYKISTNFETKGLVFLESFWGNEVERTLGSSYFDRNNRQSTDFEIKLEFLDKTKYYHGTTVIDGKEYETRELPHGLTQRFFDGEKNRPKGW